MDIAQMTTYQILFVIFIVLVVAWFVKHVVTRPKNLPPGPMGLQVVGVALDLFRRKSNLLSLFSSWADKYGDIISFRVGPRLVMILNTHEVVCEAFRHPHLQNRPHSRMLAELSGTECRGLVLGMGESWKEQRAFVFSVFRSLGVGKKNYEDIVSAEMAQLGDAIEKEQGSPFDPIILFRSAVANVICSVIFGTQYRYSDKEFQRLLSILNKTFNSVGEGSWRIFFPLPGISRVPFGTFKKLTDTIMELHEFTQAHIKVHQENFDQENPRDLIDLYLLKMKELEEKGAETFINLEYLPASINDIFSAGAETTTTTLKWCILYMMAYPEVQSRVQAEIDAVVGRERIPGVNDRKNLPYTSAVLMEVQRKGAVVPLGVPHVAATDVTLRGYTIPKNTVVLPNIWKIMNNVEQWDAPDAFNPERFLDEDGMLIKREDLLIFSTGRRVCLGMQLAQMETFLGFTSLLSKFTFRKPEKSPPISLEGVLNITRDSLPYETCAIPRKWK